MNQSSLLRFSFHLQDLKDSCSNFDGPFDQVKMELWESNGSVMLLCEIVEGCILFLDG